MKSYYCKRLYEEINFDAENVYVCCGKSLGPAFDVPQNTSIKEYCKKLINWKYNSVRNAYINKISDECKNCLELEKREISFFDFISIKFFPIFFYKKFKIKNIIIKSFRQCELACVYCLEKRYTKGKKITNIVKSDFYNFLPIFDSLLNQNLLDKQDLRIEFQGGSISVWDEFIPLLEKIKDTGIKNIQYHTNAVKFIPQIEELAKITNSSMSISIDCGCSDSYKKIKGENCFDNVVENIIKYADAGVSISCKYIIVKNVNDNIEEISKFMNLIKDIKNKVKYKDNIGCMIDIDFRESLSVPNYVIPDNYKNLLEYSIKLSKEYGIPIGFQDFIKKKILYIEENK